MTESLDDGLTLRQREVLQYIAAFVAKHGYAPSMRDIAEGVGLVSTSSVLRLLQVLEERGAIVRTPGLSRSIRLVQQ